MDWRFEACRLLRFSLSEPAEGDGEALFAA